MEKIKKVVVFYADGQTAEIEGDGTISKHSTTVDIEDPVTGKITVKPVKFVTIGMPCAEH